MTLTMKHYITPVKKVIVEAIALDYSRVCGKEMDECFVVNSIRCLMTNPSNDMFPI